MSASNSEKPTDQPPAQPYEIAIARKIKAQTLPILQIFKKFDQDDDDRVSKKDFSDTLKQWEMELKEDQINYIFERSAFFAPFNVKEIRRNDPSPDCLYFEKMGFQEFSKYVEDTANTLISTASSLFGASDIALSPQRENTKGKVAEERRSAVARARSLRRMVYKQIRESIPLDHTTKVFLQMDTLRNNQVTGKEFQEWLKKKNGLDFSDEEMKLIRGDWKKDEGLSLQEFDFFINCFYQECSRDNSNHEMIQRLSVNQNINPSPSEAEIGDAKSDEVLIWALLNYFKDYNKSYLQAFEILDVTNAKSLSAQDVQRGLQGAGMTITLGRAKDLIRNYVQVGGRMTKPGFVRLMTSAQRDED